MRCRTTKKWISDSLDKNVSERKKHYIEKHVAHCPSCRAFRENILHIEDEAKIIEMTEFTQDYKQEFGSRLKSRILSLEEKEKKETLPFFKQSRVLAPSALLFVAIIVAVFLLFLPERMPEREFYALSFGDAVEEVYREIGDDIELERAFNSQILSSIYDLLSPSAWIDLQETENDFFLWEDLTDEELKFLESEIKKEKKL
jgi:hypothetical protein